MLLDWIAQRIMDRYPALIAAGRWSLWFFIAFLASVATSIATRWKPLWILVFILAACSGFAHAASRRLEQPFRDDHDHDA